MNLASLTAVQEWTWLGLKADQWIAVAGGSVGLAGVLVAWRALVHAKRSAKASEDSARAAQKSADEAATISGIERERWHDELTPTDQKEVVGQVEGRLPDVQGLFGTIRVNRVCRVNAVATVRATDVTTTTPITGLPLLLRPNREYRFHIQRLTQGVTVRSEVWFRFWPPIPELDGADWTCQCGRPLSKEATPDGRGHWEVLLPIKLKAL
ncbi:hypothetical protein AAH991_38085 [Microbispora sp. ZYX-F-249]|uniref:Uncharacterized protein n=1 Tax=Microbispora maris TaxID=3144104 RepID=A0ABV0B3M3_9ACTN